MPTAELTRRNGVELARVGTWNLGSGVWNATREDFAAAIAATACPAVRKPALWIGHNDDRFTPRGDGEPTIGWIENLRLTDGGSTLLGDWVGIPAWLDQVAASAYPDRSVEGAYNRRCQLSHVHPFVLDGLSLLGVTRPGVGTLKPLNSLDDVKALFDSAPVAATAGEVRIAASIPGAAFAAAEESTGAMIALIPTDADAQRLAVDGGEVADQLHCTLMYLGKAEQIPDKARGLIVETVSRAVNGLPAVDAEGFAVSAFNPTSTERDTCIVLGLGGEAVDDAHHVVETAVRDLAASTMLDLPPQHRPYVPHLTLVYTDDVSQVAALTDRTGPVTFDRVRVVFGGDATDIPLVATDWGAMPALVEAGADPLGGPMPNPQPSDVDRIKLAWNSSGAPYSQHIHMVRAGVAIVLDEADRSFWRVPVTVVGDAVTFGDRQRVMPDFVDYDEALVAASVVFASREESRPEAPPDTGDPDDGPPEPRPDPPPTEDAPTTTPPDPGGVSVPPGAEPEHTTEPKGEDPVSTLSTDVRSRLGLTDDADDAAVVAALDALKTKADTPPAPDPDQVAASAAAVKENDELRKEVTVLASQVSAMSAKLAATEAEKAATVKASVLDTAQRLGKFKPADREQWSKDYDEAPGVTTRLLDRIAEGTEVPVTAAGYTGTGDEVANDPAALTSGEIDNWAKQLGINAEELTR